MQTMKIAILAQAAWILVGVAFLTVTPIGAGAQGGCPNSYCVSAYDCQYQAGEKCNMGPNWCGYTACIPT